MARNTVFSARGEAVDFDLLKIKQQMVSIPKNIVVEARENYVDNKFKRQLKRSTREAAETLSVESDSQSSTINNDVDEIIEPKES
jgi:hypothetical protein